MEPKFKKGDEVKVIAENSIFSNYISEVEEIIPINDYFVYWLKGTMQAGRPLLDGPFKEHMIELIQEEPRKIIGYKVPFDMFHGKWKKGDIVKIIYSTDYDYYVRDGNFSKNSVPKEIAEKWEPVYEEVEQPKTIFERVNSFEDACRELGLNFEAIDDITNSVQKLKIICKALNENWIADWSDIDSKKWCVLWQPNKLIVDYSYKNTHLPKSLHVKSKELAEHLIKIAKKELLEFFES